MKAPALRSLVGSLRQYASVRRIVLDDGGERGVRALAFTTGGGLDFWAMADRALDIDSSLVRFDDRIHDGQAEAGSFVLRRKKRIEYTRAMGRVDAHAGVAYGQSDSGHAECLPRFLGETDCQDTSMRHRLNRIDDQIHEDLLQLAVVTPDRMHLPTDIHSYFNRNPGQRMSG